MIGTLVIWIAFGAALVSAWSYLQLVTRKKDSIKLARRSFHVMVLSILVSSFLLLMFILQHRFEYAYVYSYSSRSLPLHFLLSTFYAGQEGSFLFWALSGVVMGVFLLNYTRRKAIEAEVMSIFVAIQAFLLLLLIAKSPFRSIWDAFPGQMAAGSVPADGRGLNPLLQNFWMVIHPPVLFIGFAAMAVPFSFAVAGLWRRKYQDWIVSSFPWVLFAILALGAGIMLGGYWAYGVLGWGGWWGWDPVENSSLIPWIIAVALIHTMVAQKKTGGFKRTNFVLAILSFLLVLYSTFLTRSGILGDASVHSFVDPGSLVYLLLIGFIGSSAILGFGLFWKRKGELKPEVEKRLILSRETFLGIGVAILCASAVVIFFGTSLPIVSKKTVEPSFYDQTNLPIAVAMALMIGLSLFAQWGMSDTREMLKRICKSLAASVIGTAILFYFGVRDLWMVILALAALFTFFVNLEETLKLVKVAPRVLGGKLAHLGLALVFLGIISSGRYGEKQNVSLELNSPREALGYRLTYLGSKLTTENKYAFEVKVEKDGKNFLLAPVMFRSDYNEGTMRNPDIKAFLSKDFYLSPISLEDGKADHAGVTYHLKKGIPVQAGDLALTFTRFDMNHDAQTKMLDGTGFPIGVAIEVKRGGKTEVVTPVSVFKENASPTYQGAFLSDKKAWIELLHVNVDMETKESTIAVALHREGENAEVGKKEILVVEASVKPFISLLWAGTIILFVGFIISIFRRTKEAYSEKR